MSGKIHQWLAGFGLDRHLHEQVMWVISRLPSAVRDDLMGDPAFSICDYEPGPAAQVTLAPPAPARPSRLVALKRTLRQRPEAFIRYVIAHELAHAHLRNGGRWPSDDPEHAADALAAAWGFPRP